VAALFTRSLNANQYSTSDMFPNVYGRWLNLPENHGDAIRSFFFILE
jgi:hypothetical protein